MDSGPSRHGHFGARGGSPPRVGCAATNRTAALRRRLAGLRIGGGIGPSGSRLGCPSDDERTVWPETGSPACWSTPEPRAAKGDLRVPTARRSIGVLRDSGREVRTQRPSGRAGVARRRPHLRVWTSAASGLSVMYARERQRTQSRSSNHRCGSSERALGRARVSSEMRRDHVGNPPPSGVGPTRWILLRADPPASHRFLRGPCGMRPRRLLREVPEPPRSHTVLPSGKADRRSHGARQGRNTLPSPDVRVGDAEAVGPQGETSSRSGRRETRGSIGTSRSKAQGSIERSRSGNVARTQRTPRRKKALRSAS